MIVLDNVLSDRGSKYAVSGGPCGSEDDARANRAMGLALALTAAPLLLILILGGVM